MSEKVPHRRFLASIVVVGAASFTVANEGALTDLVRLFDPDCLIVVGAGSWESVEFASVGAGRHEVWSLKVHIFGDVSGALQMDVSDLQHQIENVWIRRPSENAYFHYGALNDPCPRGSTCGREPERISSVTPHAAVRLILDPIIERHTYPVSIHYSTREFTPRPILQFSILDEPQSCNVENENLTNWLIRQNVVVRVIILLVVLSLVFNLMHWARKSFEKNNDKPIDNIP